MRLGILAPTLATLLALGCSHETSGTPHAEEPRPRRSATCTPTGTENAHPLERVTLPVGCQLVGGGSEAAPLVVHDATELAAAITCTGATPPSVDLAANDVYVVRYTMSPATVAMVPLDDGTTVTFATQFRRPCPEDPLPMPIGSAFAFLLPKNATRTFRSANCTLPLDCP